MKKILLVMASALLLLLMVGSVFAYGGNVEDIKRKGFGQNQGGQTYTLYDDTQVNHQIQIDNYPIEELNQEEIDGLLLMREEEKLARDVYLELYDISGQQIFSNIAQSEATHTNAIKSLLEKYDIEDPMVTDERGVFENKDLQSLYDQLVEQGSVSLLEALNVGAIVEDLDIKDLKELNENCDNQDVTAVYNNLEKGSRNHLRSFTDLIVRNGGSYIPQYISEEDYNLIVSGDMETGNEYDSNNEVISFQQGTREDSQSIFDKMWGGFKNWFN